MFPFLLRLQNPWSRWGLLGFCLAITQAHAQPINLLPLEPKTPFPSPNNHVVLKDSRGLVWLGNDRGLLKYDGHHLTSYACADSQESCFVQRSINHLMEDTLAGRKVLWISGVRGVGWIDLATEAVHELDLPQTSAQAEGSKVTFTQIIKQSDSLLWFAQGNRLICYHKTLQRLSIFLLPEKEPGEIIASIQSQPASDFLWILSNQRLYCFDAQTQRFRVERSISHPLSLFQLSNGDLIVIDDQQQWYRKGRQASEFAWLTTWGRPEVGISDLVLLPSDAMLVGTHQGLYYWPEGLKSHPDAPAWKIPLSADQVKHIYLDADERLWVSCMLGGVYLADLRRLPFQEQVLPREEMSPTSKQTSISSLMRDQRGWLWLGAKLGHMWIEMGQTRVLLRQLTNGRQTIDLKGVSAICEDGQGNLWLGGFSWGAIKILAKDVTQANLQQGVLHAQFESFTPKSPVSQALCGWSVRCLIPDGPHTLWIGTIDGGLNRYDLRSQKMSQAGHANQRPQGVWQVRPGQGPWEGYLLVGSDRQGLWLLHRQTGHFQRYGAACLPAESIRDIYQADDTLWLATNEKGVMRMRGTPAGTCEPARRIIAKGTTLKEAYCLLPDGKGHLWARIDEHLYAIDRQREVAVKQYAPQPETNGWFHLNAYYQDPRTGTMYWGKTQGYLVFHPDSLNPHRTAPPVRGVDLSIDHHSVAVGQEVAGHVVLTQHISEAKKIRIPPRTREVALTVVALDYLQPDAFDYRYQLLGYDSTWQWLPAGKQRIAFTNLPVGTYTLRMEAIMGPGGDRVAPTELIIEVLPAYYQTTWFLFLLTAFVLLCVWLLIKRRTHVLHQRNRQLSQKVAERTESLKQAHARIAAQEQARLRFYNDISHELRTPLTLVISPLEGLIEASEDQTERRADLQTIYHNARRMQHIVNQLLAIGRLEEGKWSVEPTAVDASALMSQSLAAFRLYAQQKPVGLHFDGPHEALWVQTDAVKVETILFNLLSNALKYTPPGGQVHLDSRREKDWLILTVRDNGPGIEPAKLAQVFERYVAYGEADKNSDKEPDKPQGSVGLGLAFTRKLVHLLGGGIEIDSEVGQGTEVHVRLPWVPAQAPDSTAPAPAYVSPTMGSHPAEVQHASSPAPRPEPAERPRLLLAEDHPEWRDYLARQLRRDYHVKAVAEGQAAVTAIEAFAPDLIISDVMMPGMDGLALLRRVKGDPAYHHIPVILLTARSEETHLVEGLKQGADDYLAKPVSLTLLRLKVHNLLTLRQHLIRKYQTDPHLDPADFAASQQESEFLQQVFALIEANLNNPALNVDFLASELAMSRSLLFNKLKAVTGKSAKVLIMTHKMKYAATLLGGGRYNVTEVGEKLGYADPSYFAKAFRRYVGKPPSAFLVR